MKIRPKNIVIVGGASGIGLATAKAVLKLGAEQVCIASRNEDKLIKTVEELKQEGFNNVSYVVFDIADVKSHIPFIAKCKEKLGAEADGLIISSGVNFGCHNWRGFNLTEEEYDRVMNINLKGPFFLIRNFSNHIYHNNLKANICVVSSISAHRDLLSVYQFSKNAISGIVHAYGKHLAEKGIVLNCVEPGTTDTEMMPHLRPYTDGIREGKPWPDNSIHRVIRPEEIADVICFLISENSELLSGTCLLASGGCKTISR